MAGAATADSYSENASSEPATSDKDAAIVATKVATFAGGCFWCMEPSFDKTDGVVDTVVGYTGGRTENPTYKEVSHGKTGHFEAIRVTYDPTKISYAKLLEVFWRNVDPTDGGGQFCDRGDSYKTAIFVHDSEQRQAAERSKAKLGSSAALPSPIVTPIIKAPPWWNAEDYHQDYYQKNPIRYRYYRTGCGRDKRLKELWG